MDIKVDPETRPLQAVALRVLYTAIIFTGHLSSAMMVGVSSPAMVDIRYLEGNIQTKEPASMSAISLQSTFGIFGVCLGGFISFLYNWRRLSPYINRQLLTSILSLVTAAGYAYQPQIQSISLSYILSFVNGIGVGNMTAIAVTWLIEMWSGRLLAACLQALQLSYGIGSILGPLIVRPHLYGYMKEAEAKRMNETAYQEAIDERRASLTGPYIIVGCFMGTYGLLHLVLYFSYYFRYRQPSISVPASDVDNSPSDAVKLFETPENRTSLRLFLTMIIIIFAGNNMGEVAYMGFQDAFFQSLPDQNITAAEAAVIGSITATSYTVGRGVNILVSMVLSVGNLLLLHYGLVLLGVSALFVSTSLSQFAIKLNAALLGYSFSAIMPAMFAYINLYALVNDRRNAMFTIALSAPSIFTPPLIGHYLEKAPIFLVYLVLSVLALSAAVFVFVRLYFVPKVARKVKRRGEKERAIED